jgi:hypothetical protein
VEESQLDSFLAMLLEEAYVIGKLVAGTGKVVFV